MTSLGYLAGPATPARLTTLVLATLMTLESPAWAVEHEHHLGIDAGISMLAMNDRTDVGAGVGAHWAYGLSDAFNLMVEGDWSLVTLGQTGKVPANHPSSLFHAGAGVGYVFDVLRWVPYAGLLVGGFALTGGALGEPKVRPGVTLAAGLDYRITRTWAAGFAFRQHLLVTDMSTYPSFTEFFVRFERTWGW
jgi:hypothetical protein